MKDNLRKRCSSIMEWSHREGSSTQCASIFEVWSVKGEYAHGRRYERKIAQMGLHVEFWQCFGKRVICEGVLTLASNYMSSLDSWGVLDYCSVGDFKTQSESNQEGMISLAAAEVLMFWRGKIGLVRSKIFREVSSFKDEMKTGTQHYLGFVGLLK